jgi:hypothetical protein
MTTHSTCSESSAHLIMAVRNLARQTGVVANYLGGASRRRLLILRNAAHSALRSASATSIPADKTGLLLALTRFACEANRVAHGLPESECDLVFALKGAALSALILSDSALINDVRADNTLGIDLLLAPGARLHCRPRFLTPPARQLAKRQAAIVPVCAPIWERVCPAQRDSLLRLVSRAA